MCILVVSDHKYVMKAPLRERILIAPVMIPGKSMPRTHKKIGEYEICYSSEYIHNLFRKTDKNKVVTTIDHNGLPIAVRIIASFLKGLDFTGQLNRFLPFLSKEDIAIFLNEFDSTPKGTWFQVQEFDHQEDFENLKTSGKTGLSVELTHSIIVDGEEVKIREEYERVDRPSDKLPYSLHIYGGSIWSRGRNEHGSAHFELKENGISLDKMFIPNSKEWYSTDLKGRIELLSTENGKATRKERKKIAEWLDRDGNLKRCHEAWNKNNEYNSNRVMFIY